MATLSFLGATRCVTGSKFLVEPEAASVLAAEIRDRLDLDVDVPEYRQKVSL